MQRVIIELDERTMERLNQVAPARARKRSAFIRDAIRRALTSDSRPTWSGPTQHSLRP